jgi:hypothetical protein
VSDDAVHYRIVSDLLARPVGDSILLFHPGTERLLRLGGSGIRVWELLSEEGDAERIIARLCDEFEGSEPFIQQQVMEFLSQLEAEQIICRDK